MTLSVGDHVRHSFHGVGIIKSFLNKGTVEVHFEKEIRSLNLKDLIPISQEEQDKKRNDLLVDLENLFDYTRDERFCEKVDKYRQNSIMSHISAKEYKGVLASFKDDWLKRADEFFSASCENYISVEEYERMKISFQNKLDEDVKNREQEEQKKLRDQVEKKILERKVEKELIHERGKCSLCKRLSPKSEINIVGESPKGIYITCKTCKEFFPSITTNQIERALEISQSETIDLPYALNCVIGKYNLSEAKKRSNRSRGQGSEEPTRSRGSEDIFDRWYRKTGSYGTH